MAKKFYSIDNINKINAEYKLLLGGRNIGKSYAVKHYVLKQCFDNNEEFVYLRRWEIDTLVKNSKRYFTDADIKGITNGEYNGVNIKGGEIFFINTDDKGKITKRRLIGYVHALNLAEHYKSGILPKVKYIIFEEFITNKGYIQNEPDELLQYTSTIFRTWDGVVFLVGNTISKLCPYFNEWKLDTIGNMKMYDIKLFEQTMLIQTENGVIEHELTVAVEMCGAQGILSKMAFGMSAEMITKNKWATRSVPLIDKKILADAIPCYKVYVFCDNLGFKMTLYSYNENLFWYVIPQTKEIKNIENERVISKDASLYPLHSTRFKGLNEYEQKAFNLITTGKIYYCSNMCGSDFMQVLKRYGITL